MPGAVKIVSEDASGNPVTDSAGNPAGATVTRPAGEIQLIENTGAYIYEGFAPFGTATSAASWHIIRSTLSGSNITAVERADGDGSYNNIWDNRASLTYS